MANVLKKIKTLRIDRGRWLTGRVLKAVHGRYNRDDYFSGLDSSLLDEASGLMCCLGFAAKKVGVPQSSLQGNALPGDLFEFHRNNPLGVFDETDDVTNVNDSETLTDKQRESKLIRHFKDLYKIKLSFYGDASEAVKRAKKVYVKD